ncbi:MAG: histidine kinase [Steroidobacteraceae bacterium]
MPDPFERKSQRFLPAEAYFWVLNTLGWILTLYLIDFGDVLRRSLQDEHGAFLKVYLAVLWLAYYVLGTLTVLVFRRCYYRQRWYQMKFIGSVPLVLLVALGGGLTIASLLVLPVGLMLGDDFRVYNEAGMVVAEGASSSVTFAAFEWAVLLLVWLLIYLGVEGAANARSLSLRALALENNLKDARLNALAGQINPHFLFNALNNIRFMIGRDAARAEESLVDLSEILRHSLGTSQQEKTLLTQELVIVERYLNLMKIQMQSRLEYSIHAANVPAKVLVPPMIIQMLAENAIKHGIEQIKEGGRVNVQCSLTAGKLCVEVRNSTVTADAIAGSSERPSLSVDAGGHGLGLANIGTRLSLLYGDKAQLAASRQNGDFVVRIVLPGEEGA